MDMVDDGVLVFQKSASNSEVSDLIQREAKQVYACLCPSVILTAEAGAETGGLLRVVGERVGVMGGGGL